jgi:DNA-binding MltR family transcriptional regulator
VYQLRDGPGFNPDAEHVWNHWKTINQTTQETDVTDEIIQSIKDISK